MILEYSFNPSYPPSQKMERIKKRVKGNKILFLSSFKELKYKEEKFYYRKRYILLSIICENHMFQYPISFLLLRTLKDYNLHVVSKPSCEIYESSIMMFSPNFINPNYEI